MPAIWKKRKSMLIFYKEAIGVSMFGILFSALRYMLIWLFVIFVIGIIGIVVDKIF